MIEIYKEFSFDSAHSLPNVPDDHKCKRVHGHTYRVRILLRGKLDEHYGWVEDFGNLKSICKPVIDQLDHRYLNEIKGLENPTAEIITQWIWQKIKPKLPLLHEIYLKETPSSGCFYRGE